MECGNIQREGLDSVKERWVPNTGEYLVFTNVILLATNTAGGILDIESLARGGLELFIAGAVDRGYDGSKGSATYGNIYCNSASPFEVALVKKDGSLIQKLGTLQKNSEDPWLYHMNYAGSILYDEANGKNKYSDATEMFRRNRLWIDRKNRVIGILGGVGDYYLEIRPANANVARPGDDLLLTFGVRKRGEAEAITFTTVNAADEVQRYYALATMKDMDYVAVYDKKLLWRANLYNDENSPEDWNNRHPWVTNNVWNREADGSVADGKQTISIKPFTYHMIRNNQDYMVSRNVGYFNWGYDDPFDFNEKLESQSRVLSQWYTAGSIKFSQPVLSWGGLATIQNKTLTQLYDLTFQSDIWGTIIGGFSSLNDQQKKNQIVSKMGEWIASAGTYKSTVAPGGTPSGVWSNYVGLLFNNGAYQIAGNNFFPYLPKEADILANRGKLTGADCVGFVWQSASYPDNIYSWARIDEPDMLTWTENMSYRPFEYPTTANSSLIAQSAPYDNSAAPNTNPSIPALKYLTPGDVITFHDSDEDNSNRHFAIILNVTPNEDGSVSPSGVRLIESSHRRNPLMTGASDMNSLQFYEQRRYDDDDPYGTWQVQRLSTRQ